MSDGTNSFKIPLTKGKFALVDKEDFEALRHFTWHITSKGYASRKPRRVNGKQSGILMHREIMGASPDQQVDHRNTDKLDNRRENLRVATNRQNHYNLPKFKNNTSGHKGVSWNKKSRKWRAYIKLPDGQKWLGEFTEISDAVSARSAAAKKLHGEFYRP